MCSNNCTERIEKIFKECLQSTIDSVFQKLSTQLSYQSLPHNTATLPLQENQESVPNELAITSAINPSLASFLGSVLVSSHTLVNTQGKKKKRRRRRNNHNHINRDASGKQDTLSVTAINAPRDERLISGLCIDAELKGETSSKDRKNQLASDESRETNRAPSAFSPANRRPAIIETNVITESVAEKADAPKVYKTVEDSDSEEEFLTRAKKIARERINLSSSPENVPKRYRISTEASKNRRRRSPSSVSSGSSDSHATVGASPRRHGAVGRRDGSWSSRSRSPSRSTTRSRSRSRSRCGRRASPRRRSRDSHYRRRDDRIHGSSHHRSSRRADRSSSNSRRGSHSRSRSYSRDRSSTKRSSHYNDSRRN